MKDEALARYSVSREVPRSVLKSEKLLGTLDATPKFPNIPVSLQGNTLAGHKRRIPLAVVLPHPARGAGTLIPSAQRLVWAAKQAK